MVAPISENNSIVSADCIALLHTTRNPTGYRHVYEHHAEQRRDLRRQQRYVAKVRIKGKLYRVPGSSSSSARECAKHVIRWYQQRYGDAWREELTRRMPPPPVITRRSVRCAPAPSEPWEAKWNEVDGGWNLWVWEFGTRVPVRERKYKGHGETMWRLLGPRESSWRKPNGKPLGRAKLFVSQEQAEQFVARWLRVRWGLFGESANWREAEPRLARNCA